MRARTAAAWNSGVRQYNNVATPSSSPVRFKKKKRRGKEFSLGEKAGRELYYTYSIIEEKGKKGIPFVLDARFDTFQLRVRLYEFDY